MSAYAIGQDICGFHPGFTTVCYEFSNSKMLVKSYELDANDIRNELQNTAAGSILNIEQINPLERLFWIELQPTNKENMLELVSKWNAREDVIFASIVWIAEHDIECANTDEVIVELYSEEDYPVLKQYAADYQIQDIIYNDLSHFYILTLQPNPQKNAWDTAKELYETGLFKNVSSNMLWLVPLGTHNSIPLKKDISYSIYPNPANDMLTVNLENAVPTQKTYHILLYNMQGNIIRQTKTEKSIVQLNVSNIPDGIYFLHINGGNSSIAETFKVLIKH
jgi:hypothetical protein